VGEVRESVDLRRVGKVRDGKHAVVRFRVSDRLGFQSFCIVVILARRMTWTRRDMLVDLIPALAGYLINTTAPDIQSRLSQQGWIFGVFFHPSIKMGGADVVRSQPPRRRDFEQVD
jgi:hypothetical protein